MKLSELKDVDEAMNAVKEELSNDLAESFILEKVQSDYTTNPLRLE